MSVLEAEFTRESPLAQHIGPLPRSTVLPAQMGSELGHGVYVWARTGVWHRLRARSTATATNNDR